MKKALVMLLTLGFILFSALTGTPAQENASPARAAKLLEECGYSYTKASDNVWAIKFEGKSLADITVIVSTVDETILMLAVVAEKDQLQLTPELMQKMLKFNSDLDRVKIGIDKDGDAFVRIDTGIRTLDARELKTNLDQVAAAADEVYAGIRQFIKAPQPKTK